MPPIAVGLPEPSRVEEIDTSSGPARASFFAPVRGLPRASLVLGHGAGRGIDSPDLITLAAALPAEGIEVVLVEQPWLVAGRKIADGKAKLDNSWVQVISDLRRSGVGLRSLTLGGRSAGARVACRTVGTLQPDAVLCLAFPLLEPREGKSRAEELAAAAALVPVTVIQGAHDAYGEPADVATSVAELGQRALTISVPFCDHQFSMSHRALITDSEARLILAGAARLSVLQRRRNAGPLLMR